MPPRKHTPGKHAPRTSVALPRMKHNVTRAGKATVVKVAVPVASIVKRVIVKAAAAAARPKSTNTHRSIAKHPPRIRKIPAKVVKVVTVVIPPKKAAAVSRSRNTNTRRSIARHPPARGVAKAVAKAVKEEVKKEVELEEGIEAFRARTQRVKEAIKEEAKRETLPVKVVVPDLIDLDPERRTSGAMVDEEDFFFPPDEHERFRLISEVPLRPGGHVRTGSMVLNDAIVPDSIGMTGLKRMAREDEYAKPPSSFENSSDWDRYMGYRAELRSDKRKDEDPGY